MKKLNLTKGLLISLLVLALCFTAFGAVKASAEETVTNPTPVGASYVPATDSIGTAPAGSIVYILKSDKGNTIKPGAKCYTTLGSTEDTLTAIGAKNTTKDVYLYVCNKEFEKEGKNINANLIIKAQAAKKVTITVDYTKADAGDSTTGVLSITAVDANKKEISGLTEANILWFDAENDIWKTGDEFTAGVLKKALEDGGLTIQAKMLGTRSPAVRTSKAVKVKIAAPGKAPKVKLDVSKGTLSIKNGMDFGVATGDADNPVAPTTWFTVLPVLKDAKTTDLAKSIVPTAYFKPLDKKDKAAKNAGTYTAGATVTPGTALSSGTVSYTKYSVKSITLDTLFTIINKKTDFEDGTDVFVAVRNSATSKKPASAITYVTIKGQTKAPIVITQDRVAGQKTVAVGDFAGKGISGVVVNVYPGTKKDDSNKDILATSSYWKEFKVDESGTNADPNAPIFEYAVVKKADLGTIDWATVGWKKFNEKTKISAKLATKYALIGKAAAKVELKASTLAESSDINTDANTFDTASTLLLIRRAGVKGSSVDACVPASAYIKLCVVKHGKDYKLVSQTAVGETANKYTVEFYKYTKADGTSSYAYNKDTKINAVTGWKKATETVSDVELPAIENADYAVHAGDAASTTITANSKVGFTMGSGDTTISLDIKEYANVTISAKYTPSGITSDGLTAYNTAIASAKTDLVKVENGVSTDALTVGSETRAAGAKIYIGEAISIEFPTVTGYTLAGPTPVTAPVAESSGAYSVTPVSAKEVKQTLNITVTKTTP